MNLAKQLLNNPGLIALTVVEEQQEIASIPVPKGFEQKNHSKDCTSNHPQLVYAHKQKDKNGNEILFWHVVHNHPSHHSTLSMEGLKEWRVI